jgi:hypothetical protein
MNTTTLTRDNGDRTLWHVVIDLAYEGTANDSCQDGVKKVRDILDPLIENRSGIKSVYFMRLPEKD